MTTLEGIKALSAPLFLIVLGMIALLLDLGAPSASRRRLIARLSCGGALAGGLLALAGSLGGSALISGYAEATAFGGGVIIDGFGGLSCFVLAVVAALSMGMANGYLEEKRINHGEFYALVLFATSGAMVMALANDLVNVFVGLEVLSVALYILSGFARREMRSQEAAVKYFLLGAFATGFLLYGTALIYGSTGLASQAAGLPVKGPLSYTNFVVIGDALRDTASTVTPLATSPLFIAGIALVIVGLGFKAAIVPFHSYAPDVYEGAPTPVTALMSVIAKAGAFAAMLRLFQALTDGHATAPFHGILWGLAAATMIVGNVLAVRQTGIKRMLAYSSIAHAGYILVGVLASLHSGESKVAIEAVRNYLLAYSFMNVGAFAVVIWLGRDGGEYREIRNYAGLAKRQPLAAAVLSLFLLSLGGIPLTAGFLGKLYLFLSAIQAGEIGLAVLGLVVSAIGVFYYLNLIVQMYFREPEQEFTAPRAGGAKTVALICALCTIVFGVCVVPVLGPSVAAAIDVPHRPRTRPVSEPPSDSGAATPSATPRRGQDAPGSPP